MRKIITISLLLACCKYYVLAQQTPIYSQYILNEFVINPAVAGYDGMTTINLTGRKQWLGWEYGPETYSTSFSTRILKSVKPFGKKKRNSKGIVKGPSGRVGLGGSIIRDKNGAVDKTSINFTYAYHLDVRNAQLSLGLSFLATQFRIDNELAELRGGDDPLEGAIGSSTYSPDAAAGVNLTGDKYRLGFSAFNLLQSPIKFGVSSSESKELRQIRYYHVIGVYRDVFPGNKDWEYEPSIVVRGNEVLQLNMDISTRFIYNREYWFGFSYRTSKDIVALLGIKLAPVYIGYSFDYGFSEISRLSYGNHEIAIAIKLGDSKRRYRWWERY